jgi:hypothetical protein
MPEQTREEWIDSNWGATPPEPWTIDREMEMPEELRDLSWVGKLQQLRYPEDFDVENDYPDLPGRLAGTAIPKKPAKDTGWRSPRFPKPQ